jgi:hypothetical protein
MARKEIKKTSDNRGFADCGSKVVSNCNNAPAEGLKSYTHPLQGSAKDCGVIAALSSIAAVNKARMVGSYPNYTFLSKVITLKTKLLAVDAMGTWVYARSNGGSWPMLWEKAFAMLISTATRTAPASCNGEPDIAAAFAQGVSGIYALKEIGRYQKEVYWTIPYDGASGNLLWPAIATTNSTLTQDTFWKRDHDYSVIKFDTTKKQYLIRNPCGGEERLVDQNQFSIGTSTLFKVWGHVEY